MSIKALSKETIKLINSTQVISSIYSAIKELVENSLDAQAQNIEVNLVDNGLSLIEVKDNGTGICRDDAQYMALPSYTSKISDFNDLDLLSTYGFRGEGLTSICQVSDVTICTKTVNDETMICYTLDYEGHVVASELSHGSTGTTVQMRYLFKNMPVRRNILNNKKKINQEIKAIEILLKTYSICKPSIRFIYRVNNSTIFTKPSCKNIIEAIKSVLGIQIFSKLTYLEKSLLQSEIQLFIPKKDIKDCAEISQVGLQFVCVNDRPIKSKEIEKKINKRISEYFNQNGSNSRKFIFCLTLKVDSSMLDVNLEPNKDKVFLHNEAVILNEIDNSLLFYYELQNSQASTQSEIENINCNGNINKSEKLKEKEEAKEKEKGKEIEKEWPACKKRKLNSQNESIQDISMANKTVLLPKQSTDETRKNIDNDFLKDIRGPVLSESDSNDGDDFKKQLKKINNANKIMDILEVANEDSEDFDLAQNVPIKNEDTEALSQLPEVDLGEDFDWQEIIGKNNKSSNSISESTDTVTNEEILNDVIWSKGQVPGLQGGVTIAFPKNVNHERAFKENYDIQSEESEPIELLQDVKKVDLDKELVSNDNVPIHEVNEFDWKTTVKNSRKRTPTKKNNDKPNTPGGSKQVRRSLNEHDPTQTKIPFAGDNACLNIMGPSAFAMYCADARTKILRQHSELTPAEVAVYMNKQWKEISPEEREYYRDLANQHNQSVSNLSMTQTSKKPKSQPTQAEKEKNRKQLINMLGNMKINKAEVKNNSMIMRTYVPWDINIPLITEKLKKPATKEEKFIVGSLNSLTWIIRINSNLFIFNILDLHSKLNIKDYDMSQINAGHVKELINQWFIEKNDMSVFHLLHSIKA